MRGDLKDGAPADFQLPKAAPADPAGPRVRESLRVLDVRDYRAFASIDRSDPATRRSGRSDRGQLTFREIANDALAYADEHKRSAQQDRWRMKKMLEWFGPKRAASIRAKEIEDRFKEQNWAPATWNRHRALLSLTFRLVIRAEKLTENPRSARSAQDRAQRTRPVPVARRREAFEGGNSGAVSRAATRVRVGTSHRVAAVRAVRSAVGSSELGAASSDHSAGQGRQDEPLSVERRRTGSIEDFATPDGCNWFHLRFRRPASAMVR